MTEAKEQYGWTPSQPNPLDKANRPMHSEWDQNDIDKVIDFVVEDF